MLGFEVLGLVPISSRNDMLEAKGGISEPEWARCAAFFLMTEVDRDLLLPNSTQIEAYIICTFHFQASLLTVNIHWLAGSISALLSFFIHITHILPHHPTIACGSRTLFSSCLRPHHSYPPTVPSFANGHTHDMDNLHPAPDDMDNLHLAPDDINNLHPAPDDMDTLHPAHDDMSSLHPAYVFNMDSFQSANDGMDIDIFFHSDAPSRVTDFYIVSNPIFVSIPLKLTDSVTQFLLIRRTPAAQNVHPPRSLLTLALSLGSNIFSLLAKRWLTSPAIHTVALL